MHLGEIIVLKPRLRWQLRGWRFSTPPSSPERTLSHNALPVDSKVGLQRSDGAGPSGSECDYNGSSSGGGETTSSGEDVQDSDSTGSDSGGSSRESGGLHILSDAENAEFQAARFTHLNRRRKSMSLNMRKELIDPVDPVVLGRRCPATTMRNPSAWF